MSEIDNLLLEKTMPGWVPEPVRHYLAHTVGGVSIRSIARRCEVHPSTVLRQVRRFEALRDDPLVDDALKCLGALREPPVHNPSTHEATMTLQSNIAMTLDDPLKAEQRFEDEAFPVLRRLGEPGALLAVARDMDQGVIMRENPQGDPLRTAVVSRDTAQALALKGWIVPSDPSQRVLRYVLTNAGRSALREIVAQQENRANGFRDNVDRAPSWDRGARVIATESPLVGLARRRDKDGQPFLTPELVQAGERLREDFELSGVMIETPDEWADAKVSATTTGQVAAMEDARARVQAALDELGAGLSDIALRCCCLLEGLEVTEKKLGWSARSGKIVLRIALQRLLRHYAAQGKYRPMIG